MHKGRNALGLGMCKGTPAYRRQTLNYLRGIQEPLTYKHSSTFLANSELTMNAREVAVSGVPGDDLP